MLRPTQIRDFEMKKIFLLLLLAVATISCEKKINGGYIADISGKWKLIAVYYWDLEPLTIDYFQNNIIYDFNANNELIVSGKIENIDDYRGHSKGKHFYEVLPIIDIPAGSDPPRPEVKIDTETHGFSFGWVFFKFYEGNAMHLSTKKGTLILVKMT